MNLKEIKEKVLSGDFKSLLYPGTKTDIHPADVAKILDTLPVETAYSSFIAFPEQKKPVLFAYLGHFLQRRIIARIDKEEASGILNHLNSTDRYTFFTCLTPIERSKFFGLPG